MGPYLAYSIEQGRYWGPDYGPIYWNPMGNPVRPLSLKDLNYGPLF